MPVTEGNAGTTNATFTVTLAGSPTRHRHGQLRDRQRAPPPPPADYTATSGTLTFAAGHHHPDDHGAGRGRHRRRAQRDLPREPHRRLRNATITDNQGVGTIIDDDATPPGQLSIDNAPVTEGDTGTTNATFTVTLAGTPTGTVTVDYATADGSATAARRLHRHQRHAHLPAGHHHPDDHGAGRGRHAGRARRDLRGQPHEPVSNATIADAQGIGTILDDDEPPPPTRSRSRRERHQHGRHPALRDRAVQPVRRRERQRDGPLLGHRRPTRRPAQPRPIRPARQPSATPAPRPARHDHRVRRHRTQRHPGCRGAGQRRGDQDLGRSAHRRLPLRDRGRGQDQGRQRPQGRLRHRGDLRPTAHRQGPLLGSWPRPALHAQVDRDHRGDSLSADRTAATILGPATINGAGSVDFRIEVKDLPHAPDSFRIQLSNGYDSGTQTLRKGDIDVECNCDVEGRGAIKAANGDSAAFSLAAAGDPARRQAALQRIRARPPPRAQVHRDHAGRRERRPDPGDRARHGARSTAPARSSSALDVQDLPGAPDTFRITLGDGYDSGEQRSATATSTSSAEMGITTNGATATVTATRVGTRATGRSSGAGSRLSRAPVAAPGHPLPEPARTPARGRCPTRPRAAARPARRSPPAPAGCPGSCFSRSSCRGS